MVARRRRGRDAKDAQQLGAARETDEPMIAWDIVTPKRVIWSNVTIVLRRRNFTQVRHVRHTQPFIPQCKRADVYIFQGDPFDQWAQHKLHRMSTMQTSHSPCEIKKQTCVRARACACVCAFALVSSISHWEHPFWVSVSSDDGWKQH